MIQNSVLNQYLFLPYFEILMKKIYTFTLVCRNSAFFGLHLFFISAGFSPLTDKTLSTVIKFDIKSCPKVKNYLNLPKGI